MATTAGDFAALLRSHDLLEPEQLAALPSMQRSHPDPKGLARELMKRGWLTAFQANQVFQGKAADLVLGSYVLLERLGEGGMGAVYKARHRTMDRVVALKVIRKDKLGSESAVKRFRREVQAAAQLNHPNVVRAFDADQAGGAHFLVMEYVEGQDLARVVKERGPLPIAEACDCIRQAALGLDNAHRHGMVHRDIKPANLLLASRDRPGAAAPTTLPDGSGAPGVIKILDMGLARLDTGTVAGDSTSTLTKDGAVMGTPDYIAPEQALESHTVDIRADLYSLGGSFYFFLTGRVPFPGGSLTEKLLKHQLQEPEPVEQLRPDVPANVTAVVRKLMAKRPEERFQTPAELAHVLANLARQGQEPPRQDGSFPPRVHAPTAPTNDVEPSTVTTIGTRQRHRQAESRRRWLVVNVAAGTVLLALAGMLAFLFSRTAPKPAPPPAAAATSIIVQVAANRAWQDTGIDVKAGQETTLTPDGRWVKKSQVPCSAQGLEGLERDRTVLPDAPHMGLLARIGGQPEPLFIGARTMLPPTSSGRLWVQPNDLDLADNGGQLRLAVEGGVRAEAVAAPPPTLTEEAGAALPALLARVTAGGDGDRHRADVLDFERRFAGTAQAARASELLRSLPSPLDRLETTAIPPDSRYDGQPAELVAVLGTDRGKHGSIPDGLVASMDGKWVASGSRDGGIRVWHGDSGRLYAVLGGRASLGPALAFSPDSRTLARAAGGNTVVVWDVASQKEIASFPHDSSVRSLAFVPDGKTLAAVWKEGFASDAPCGYLLWDLTTQQRKAAWSGPPGGIYAVAVSPDGRVMAGGNHDGTVQLWDTATLQELGVLKGHAGPVRALAFTPDGRSLVSGGDDRIALVWNVSERRQQATLKGHENGVLAVAVSPDGQRIATGSADKTARLWLATDGSERACLRGHTGHVAGAAFVEAGTTLVSCGGEGVLRRWDVGNGREIGPPSGHFGPALRVAFSPDSRILASSGGPTVQLWDVTAMTPREQAVLRPGALALAFAPDGRTLATGGGDRIAHLWDLTGAEPKERAVLAPGGGYVQSLAFSPDGLMVATGVIQPNGPAVHVWDALTGQERQGLSLNQQVFWLAFRPYGRLLAFSPYGFTSLLEWDGKEYVQRAEARGNVLGFTPDGRTLVTHAGGLIQLWDLTAPVPVEREDFALKGQVLHPLAVSDDGRTLATQRAEGRVQVWELPAGRLLHDWVLPARVNGAAFAPDGRHLAVANDNGAAYIFRLAGLAR